MEKNCIQCGYLFQKLPTRSVKDFTERAKVCSKECQAFYRVGRPLSEGTRKKMSGRVPWNKGKDTTIVCKECQIHFVVPEWRARQKPQFCSHSCASQNKDYGKAPLEKKIRQSAAYKAWRTLVFERDDYTCQFCGVRGGTLHADHIQPFAFYPELRFEISNGRTLCVPCHVKTPTYGGKVRTLIKTLWANAV